MQPDWWRTFFSGPVVDFWLRAMPEEATKTEATFLEEALNLPRGSKLLDVPCGGGRHALALAARGYAMTAVDISPDFLTVARAMAEERELKTDWHEREMRDLPWTAAFDGAYTFGNSFGYLEEGENAAFLAAVARSLRVGGRYVLETGYLVESLLPSLQDRSWYPDGDGHVLSSRRYDPMTGRLHVAYTFLNDGQAVTRETSSRLHTVREVIAMAEAADFGSIETYGSLTREPYTMGSRHLLLVGTKR